MNFQLPNPLFAIFGGAVSAHEFSPARAEKKKRDFFDDIKRQLQREEIDFVRQADLIAEFYHGDILRDNGREFYVAHPRGMAASADTEIQAATRLLHDVLEESKKYSGDEYKFTPRYKAPCTLDDLRQAGQPERVVRRVGLMTREGMPYLNYSMHLAREAYRPESEDQDVLRDKISDIDFNIVDASRIKAKVYALVKGFYQAIEDRKASPFMQIEDFAKQRGLHDPEIFQPKYYDRYAALKMGLLTDNPAVHPA